MVGWHGWTKLHYENSARYGRLNSPPKSPKAADRKRPLMVGGNTNGLHTVSLLNVPCMISNSWGLVLVWFITLLLQGIYS